MASAKAAMVVGSLLVVLGFWVGTDLPISATVGEHSYGCDAVITSSMLVSGQPDEHTFGQDGRTKAERALDTRVEIACARVRSRATWGVWGVLGTGALVLVAGWTASRERERQPDSVGPVTGEPPRRTSA